MDGRFKAESDDNGKFQSRQSTQKRQKQYFEQKKRQQQNLQMTAPESSDVLGISGQHLKEHRSLDILNLLNLSTNAQECHSACLKGSADGEANVSSVPGNILANQPTLFTDMGSPVESFRIKEARAPLDCQIEASKEKVSVTAPVYQNGALNGIPCKPSNWKTMTDQQAELSVIDLLCDDGPNVTGEERPTFEEHVAFSLEGLGKVGTVTPVHSPQQPNRIRHGYSPLLKEGKKKKLSKDVNHVLEDLELEVDTMMRDIKVAPISSFSNFPYNEGSHGYNRFDNHANKIGSYISQEFFYNSENDNDDIWNVPSSSYLDEKFDNEREYNTSWRKKPFQMGTSSPDLLKSGVFKASYAFEDHVPKKRSSAAAMEGFDMIELSASYSKLQPENDYDFLVTSGARCSRSDKNFNVQSLEPEDVRDNSSLLSEESCSSTAVSGEAITHSPLRLATGENSKEHKYAFASPGNKCRFKEGKCRSISTSSKQKPSHYSDSILEEEVGAYNGWQFEERYASVNINSGDTSFCQNLKTKFAVLGSNNRSEDPFSFFTTPELHDKACPSFSGLKNGAHVAGSPPCSLTSEKFAFGDLPVFSDDRSWSTGPKFSPKFQLKGNPEEVASFNCVTPTTDLSVEESVNKEEDMKVKMQQDSHENSEPREEIFMRNNRWSSEKKMVRDTSPSNNHTLDSEVEEDTNIKIAESLETTHFGYVGEISSLLKKPDKNEGKVDKTKVNCDAQIPLKCKIANKDMENCQPEESNMVTKTHKEQINFSGQVTIESYVFQLLRVQKVLKEAALLPSDSYTGSY